MKTHTRLTLACLSIVFNLFPNLLNAQGIELVKGSTERQKVQVQVTKVTDPAGHSCCVIAPPNIMDLFVLEGKLFIDEVQGSNSAPYLPFESMAVDSQLGFTGQGRSTVAGYSNILSVFTGSITDGVITAQLKVGADGGLPSAAAITYDLQIKPDFGTEFFITQQSVPQMGVQASLGTVINIVDRQIETDQPLTSTLSLNTGGETADADWWLVLLNDGEFHSFNINTGLFEPGLRPTFQGPLVDITDPIEFIRNFVPPSNDFTIAFGIDRTPNGTLDEDTLTATGIRYYFF